MSENTLMQTEMLNEKLENLWQQYSGLFNDYNPILEDVQSEKMDYLMEEIRSIENEKERGDVVETH